ncbi:MAG: flippase-like domain-containing protein [Chloroflexi bacterium]|nr:flippase-like domain-containing protein [Chloroflexota bacterium]
MLKSPRFWIGLVISAACLFFAFQGIQFDKLFEALAHMDYTLLGLAAIMWCISYVGRVYRWQLLFSPQPMRISKVFYALNIGYFLSNLLPARLGDIVRAYLIGEFENVSKARGLSTVVVERLTDGLTVVLLLSITAIFVPSIPDAARQGAIGVAVTGIIGVIVLLALSFNKERGMAILHRLAAPFPFLQRPSLWKALESLIDGFAILRSPRPIIGVVLWAIYTWVTGAVPFWLVMQAVGLRDGTGNPLPFAAAVLVMTVTSLGVVVPSSPGYIGVFHAVAVLVLTTIYNADKSTSLSYAIVVHALSYLMLTVLGIFSIWKEGLTYQRLQMIQTDEPRVPAA